MNKTDIDIPPHDPKARGARLKRVRNLTNQPRQTFCFNEDLNINTYKGWEIGRHGGLTPQAAELLSKAFSKYGVICTPQWLLEAEGGSPQVIGDFEQNSKLTQSTDDTQQIRNEINFLKQTHEDILIFQIENNDMAPFYHTGDTVAGLQQTAEFKKLINQAVIAELEGNRFVVRILRNCSKHKTLCLLSEINKKHNIHKASIKSIAPIIWHRRHKSG